MDAGWPFLFKLHSPHNFVVGGGSFVRFTALPCFLAWTRPELQRLMCIIAARVTRALERQGPLTRDDETPSLDLHPDDEFDQLLAAAVHYRIATGPHAGRKALTLRTVASNPLAPNYPHPSRRARGRRHQSPPRTAAACLQSRTPCLPITDPTLTAPAAAPQPRCASRPAPLGIHRLLDTRS